MKSEPAPDFSVIQGDQLDEQGLPRPNKQAQAFQSAVAEKLEELGYREDGSTTSIYDKLCKAVNHTAETTLPKIKRKSGVRRKVSQKTKDLYDNEEARTARTENQRAELKEKRRKAGLEDFKSWVQECADRLNEANGHGDTKVIHDLVKQMEGKPGKPGKNGKNPENYTRD